MKIAVTGATGSLGGAILKRLASEGHEVVGLGRNEAKLSQLTEDGFEVANCDILDVNAIENSIIGVDILVHCAAYASPFGSRRKYFETNVQGTKNIFIAAKYRSVKRLIVISSASIAQTTASRKCPKQVMSISASPLPIVKYRLSEISRSSLGMSVSSPLPNTALGRKPIHGMSVCSKQYNSLSYLLAP